MIEKPLNINSMYRINEGLSKEENLRLAKEFNDKVNDLLSQFEKLTNEANKLVPGNTFGLSEAKRAKLRTTEEVLKRLNSSTMAYYNVKSTYETRERMAAEKEKLEREKLEKEKRESERSQYLNEAIKFCLDNGRTFGDGLTVETAITIANDIAFNLEVKRREEEIGDEYIDFDGQNCEDECAGWSPSNRRCSCGNRRVSWSEGWTADFKNMYIYAEAY
jgi:hypothetical protein